MAMLNSQMVNGSKWTLVFRMFKSASFDHIPFLKALEKIRQPAHILCTDGALPR